MKRLLDSAGALATAWLVVAGVTIGLAALAFLQPPPPAGGDPVTVSLAPLAEPGAAPESNSEAGPQAAAQPSPRAHPEAPPAEAPPPETPTAPAPEQALPEEEVEEEVEQEAKQGVEQPAPPAAATRTKEDAPAQEALTRIPIIPPAPEQLPQWQRYAQPFNTADQRPRIAVVLTGLGLSDSATKAAIEQLPAAVTLSFSPYARGLERWIDLARARGHEVMLDLPMEPTTFPNEDPGPQALLTSLAPQENLNRLDWVLGRGSAYVGVAGSMGSRFTTMREAIVPILREVKDRGLLFVDRHTSEESLVPSLAEHLGLPYAVNSRSIDERQASRVAIDARLAQVERIALSEGSAVAMAQPYPVTLDRLAEWTGQLTARGFALAPITALVDGQEAP